MNKAKEKISYLKLWLTFLVAIDVGSTAWLFNQTEQISYLKFSATLVLIIIVTIIITLIHKKVYKTIRNLGD